MNANQIASAMYRNLKSYINGETPYEEFRDIMQSLGNKAFTAGIEEETSKIYWGLCQGWLNRLAA